MNFWQQLPKPFFALAPMDDVTDVVFRQVVAQAAAPDVFFTEFVSTDGLQSAGRASTLERLRLEPNLNRPLVAQIWGNDPDKYHASARDISAINERQAAAGAPAFAGIDINLGCPERGIVARGCCGGLIGHNSRVAELIAATKAGAPELPVSVKTRLGLGRIITEDWAGFLLTQDLAALTIHGRTVREMSKVPAHWDEIAKVAALRAQIAPHTVLLGNGDVDSRAQGETLAQTTGVDGIMIGRGIFKTPTCLPPHPNPAVPKLSCSSSLATSIFMSNGGVLSRTKPSRNSSKSTSTAGPAPPTSALVSWTPAPPPKPAPLLKCLIRPASKSMLALAQTSTARYIPATLGAQYGQSQDPADPGLRQSASRLHLSPPKRYGSAMIKAALLLMAALIYVGFLQWETATAHAHIADLQKLYTRATADSAAISVTIR
jgi:tRNA-dihydrouridine synthase